MTPDQLDEWSFFCEKLKHLRSGMSSLDVDRVSSEGIRGQAKALVQLYFANTKPDLEARGVNTRSLDELALILLELANKRTSKKSYLELFKKMEDARRETETQRVTRLSSPTTGRSGAFSVLQGVETQILNTLERLLPLCAESYKQVVLDLSDRSRVSFRGTAAELREILREVLDHLAPDNEVMSSPGFRPEKDRPRPTMKQKAHFVLNSRKKTKSALDTAVYATAIIDETVGCFARSTYERASLSTHVSLPREEVQQLKMYADAVLCELLEIHSHAGLSSASSRT